MSGSGVKYGTPFNLLSKCHFEVKLGCSQSNGLHKTESRTGSPKFSTSTIVSNSQLPRSAIEAHNMSTDNNKIFVGYAD